MSDDVGETQEEAAPPAEAFLKVDRLWTLSHPVGFPSRRHLHKLLTARAHSSQQMLTSELLGSQRGLQRQSQPGPC